MYGFNSKYCVIQSYEQLEIIKLILIQYGLEPSFIVEHGLTHKPRNWFVNNLATVRIDNNTFSLVSYKKDVLKNLPNHSEITYDELLKY